MSPTEQELLRLLAALQDAGVDSELLDPLVNSVAERFADAAARTEHDDAAEAADYEAAFSYTEQVNRQGVAAQVVFLIDQLGWDYGCTVLADKFDLDW